jgi:hypothetical protein
MICRPFVLIYSCRTFSEHDLRHTGYSLYPNFVTLDNFEIDIYNEYILYFQDYCLLGCNAARFGRWVPMFRRNPSFPSGVWKRQCVATVYD